MIFTTLENNKSIKDKSKAGAKSALDLEKKSLTANIISVLVPIVFWFAVWYVLALYIGKEVILPSPTDVIINLAKLMGDNNFWISCGTTILRIIGGTVFGCVFGILLALLIFASKPLRLIFMPLVSAVKATPVASFIIAALFWFTRGQVPTFISFLIVLPVICDAVYTGMKNTDTGLLEMAQVYRFSSAKKFTDIYIPSTVPYFLSAVRTSVGMAWKSGVAAEVLCTPAGSIGKELYLTKVYMETTDMFAWTLVIIILSIIFEKITVWAIGRGLTKYGIITEVGNAESL